jgi:hypothetical protein
MRDYDPTPPGDQEEDFKEQIEASISKAVPFPTYEVAGREYRYQMDITHGKEMFHVRCDDWKDFTRAVSNIQSIIPSEEPFPNDSGSVATTPQKASGITPLCPIHKKPMALRMGQYGAFFSCSTKLDDGTWCNYRPPKKPTK